MRILKGIIAIVIIGALCAGAYIYLSQTPNTSSSQTSSENVIINEYMASNSGFLPDDKGQYNDWIEIYNLSGSAVDLSAFSLSNDKKTAKWSFPHITLDSKQYLVVFASGNGTSDPNAVYQHTNFKLSADKGGVYLFNSKGEIVDSEEYTEKQASDISLGRDPGDSSKWIKFTHPTPGFVNNEDGYTAFLQSRLAKDPQLLITEAMPSNKATIADKSGNYNDYIEIYNKGDKAIDLTGYGLSDDPVKVLKWKFPSVTLDPGKYIVLFASGEDKKSTDLTSGEIHTDFKLSAYKETIVLSDNMGYILDQVSLSELPADTAYAREMDASGAYGSGWAQTNKPSPGFPNNDKGNSDFKANKK